MIVHVTGGEIPQDEVERYKARAEELHPGTHTLDIAVDGDMVDLGYHIAGFDRIRRIA